MRRNYILEIGTWAVASLGLALAILLPQTIHAVDATGKPAGEIARPRLVINGCELSVHLQRAAQEKAAGPVVTLATGEELVLEVTAVNTSQAAAKISFAVQVTSMAPTSPMSRVPAMPQQIWSHSGEIAVGSGQRTSVVLSTHVSPQAGATTNVILSAGGQKITPLTITVPGSSATTRPSGALPHTSVR